MCIVKTVTFTVVLLFAQVTDEQKPDLFSEQTSDVLELCVFCSRDDPNVVEAWNLYKSLYDEVKAGSKSVEDAKREFRPKLETFFIPLQKRIKAAGLITKSVILFAYILSEGTSISRASSWYWAIWLSEAIFFFVIGVILWLVAWFLERFFYAMSVPTYLRGIVLVVWGIQAISFFILLAGGFIPLLHVIAVIAGILASLAAIGMFVLKLQS